MRPDTSITHKPAVIKSMKERKMGEKREMMSEEQQREAAANESHTSQQRYNDSLPKYNTGQRQRNCAFRVKERLMDGERKKERKTVMRHRRRQKDSPSWRGILNGCSPLIL